MIAINKTNPAELTIEVGRTTNHHRKGNVYPSRRETSFGEGHAPRRRRSRNIRIAIDAAKDTLREEIEKYKDKNLEIAIIEPWNQKKQLEIFLRDRMKDKGISLKRLADLTGIAINHIENMLRGDFEHVPPTPYFRGYLIRLGEVLNFDGEAWWEKIKREEG